MKTKEPNKFEKMAKNLISGPILARLTQIWSLKIFCRFYLY